MTTATQATTATLTSLDYAIEADGINADSVSLLLLAHTARDLGVDDLLVSLMVDEEQPEVARVRAYARVATAVGDRLPARATIKTHRELMPAC